MAMSMKGKARDLDEDDVRIRPMRSTRPRTKDRPDYSKATQALVIAVDRGRSTCVIQDSHVRVTAMKSRELGKKSVVVGDSVGLVGDLTGSQGTLARIVSVLPRRNSLTRTIDDSAESERMIVANVDQMGIVIAAANPEPRQGFVDRALVVAYDQSITPFILVTKRDLSDADAFLAPYRDLEVEILETKRGDDLSKLRMKLIGHRTVLLGHSGVGKSTLVNALVDSADRLTGSVNDVTGRGRHTSSSAVALELNEKNGWIIDTPGVRSFGISHIEIERVLAAFSEFREAIEHCPRNCSHDEESCALNAWPSLTQHDRARLTSLRRILVSSKSS